MKCFTIFVLIYATISSAGDKVVDTSPENYIAHGYSENASKALAKQESCNTAKRELMAFVFGAAFQLNQNMIRSLGVMDYSQDVSVNTGEIVLRAAMTETSVLDGVTECLITYPIQEANIEKDRLKSAQNKNIRFVDIGDPNNIRGGVLEIVTIPEDTDVLIDNVRWGTTPLRLNGKLSAGTHLIRLENQNYKIVEETIEVSNAKTRIQKILKRATGKLKMITDPEGAAIKINEEDIGHSPTNEIELIAGQKLKVEVSHPETETYVQFITLSRDEVKTINQKLLLKPGFISLNVVPNKDVMIGIDGTIKSNLLPNSWIQLEAGTHEISVSAKDYAETSFSVDLRGGEKKAMPTITLVTFAEEEKTKLAEEKRLAGISRSEEKYREELKIFAEEERTSRLLTKHFILGCDSYYKTPRYSKTGVGIIFGGQKSFFNNYFGLQLLGSIGGESSVASENHNYQTISLGLPIYFGSFYLSPAYGIRYDQITEYTRTYYPSGGLGEMTSKETKTNKTFEYYGAGFIFPGNDAPSVASFYLEGGITKYKYTSGNDPTLKFGFRWNFK